jgi:hypothetical protein
MKRLDLSLRFSSAGKTEKSLKIASAPAEIRSGYVSSSVSFGSFCWT